MRCINNIERAEEGSEEGKTGKKLARKKAGRRGQWSSSLLDDFVDMIVNNENYKKKLVFQNTKYQQNGVLYDSILQELKRRAAARGDVVEFTVSQLRNKFKKCVSDCKKAALTIKTATGVKRFQNEKGFGVWFDHLFALIKTRDSCNPDKGTEPSANAQEDVEGSVDSDVQERDFVPIRSKESAKRKKKDDSLSDVVQLVKSMVERDPMKDLIELMREKMKQSREHELRLYQHMFNSVNAGSFAPQRQSPDMSSSFQPNPYYQSNSAPIGSFSNAVNQAMPGFNYEQPQFFPGPISFSSPHSQDSSDSSKNYESL